MGPAADKHQTPTHRLKLYAEAPDPPSCAGDSVVADFFVDGYSRNSGSLNCCMFCFTTPITPSVERPLSEREVVCSNPGCTIPKV